MSSNRKLFWGTVAVATALCALPLIGTYITQNQIALEDIDNIFNKQSMPAPEIGQKPVDFSEQIMKKNNEVSGDLFPADNQEEQNSSAPQEEPLVAIETPVKISTKNYTEPSTEDLVNTQVETEATEQIKELPIFIDETELKQAANPLSITELEEENESITNDNNQDIDEIQNPAINNSKTIQRSTRPSFKGNKLATL